jgi:hypothetical protein
MSTMTSSIFKKFAHFIGMKILGCNNLDNVKESILDCLGGKLIMNFSNILTKVPKEFLCKFGANVNRVIPEVLNKYADYLQQ